MPANRVKEFITKYCCHTKGVWAGHPFILLDWQKKMIDDLFGTMRNGVRQYRTCYLEIPKKNGKTELGAAIGLYMLCADRENTPEVYSVATDKDTAGIAYQAASYMVKHNKDLLSKVKVLDSRKMLIHKTNSGFYQVLAAEGFRQHGKSPSCVLFDELHAQKQEELYMTMTSGTDYGRAQQLVFVMTTAGIYDTTSIWWRIRSKARQVYDGLIEDDTFLPILFIADPERDDPDDEELWRRVNPSIDRIFTMDKIRRDYNTAKNDPVEFQNFLRFRLNIPIKQVIRWLPMGAWDKCSGTVNPDTLEGRVCYGGLDLSTKLDLTAFVLVFPADNGEKTQILCRFYVPEDTIMERSRSDRVHYNIWEKQGFIKATPGNVIDTEFILKDIVAASEKYQIVEIGFDPWGATDLANKLYNDYGITMVEVRQGVKSLSEPAKDLLVKLMQQKINHGNNPVLRWNADNLVMVQDANENVRPDKEKATERIDGMVALIIAWSRMMFSEGESIYEKEGIEML